MFLHVWLAYPWVLWTFLICLSIIWTNLTKHACFTILATFILYLNHHLLHPLPWHNLSSSQCHPTKCHPLENQEYRSNPYGGRNKALAISWTTQTTHTITMSIPIPHHIMRHHLHHSPSLPLNHKMGHHPLTMSIQTRLLKIIHYHLCFHLKWQMSTPYTPSKLKNSPILLIWASSISSYPKNFILQQCLIPLLPKWMPMGVIVLVASTITTTFKRWRMILTTSFPSSCHPGFYNPYPKTPLHLAVASSREACMITNKTGFNMRYPRRLD